MRGGKVNDPCRAVLTVIARGAKNTRHAGGCSGCRGIDRNGSVPVISVPIMIVVMAAIMATATVVVMSMAMIARRRYEAAAERQRTRQQTEGDENGGHESAHGLLLR